MYSTSIVLYLGLIKQIKEEKGKEEEVMEDKKEEAEWCGEEEREEGMLEREKRVRGGGRVGNILVLHNDWQYLCGLNCLQHPSYKSLKGFPAFRHPWLSW